MYRFKSDQTEGLVAMHKSRLINQLSLIGGMAVRIGVGVG